VRRSNPRYEIVFKPSVEDPPVTVHASLTANEATVLFAAELQRLMSGRANGELEIRRKAAPSTKPAVVIRQTVAPPST
jgi:hypothetical protein